ncbi:MAG: ABC transporter permease [Deltaproteobacteria bacterium]|nr:ABC transporter permease [Deltaproteobacteria bacterium]
MRKPGGHEHRTCECKRKLLAWTLALAAAAAAVAAAGESPVTVFKILWNSAFGSAENFSYTLFYVTPMLLTGAAVALALEAGLFNIGAEGQLYAGALMAAAWGALTRGWTAAGAAPAILAGGAVLAFAGGAFWGAIAGYLRAYRKTHEVISTIMLNFVAMALVNWVILNPLKNPENQNLETVWVAEAARVARPWLQMTWGLPAALLAAFGALWAVRRTWLGFRIRATGANETAAGIAGIATLRTELLTMAASGGIAGLVGFHEVFLNSYRLIDSFSPGFGFTGLAVALLARGNFVKLVLAALLFGALSKGALDLDLETERVTRDLSTVIQAIILLALAVTAGKKGERG